MKKIFLLVLCIALIIISLSIAYYFVIFLPQYRTDLKKIQQDISETKDSIKETQNSVEDIHSFPDTDNIESDVSDIKNALQEQQWEDDKRNSCESNGGKYLGNGSCCLTNCSNWIGQ